MKTSVTLYIMSLLVKFTEKLVIIAKHHNDVPFEKYNEAVILHKKVLSDYNEVKNKTN